VPRSSTPKNTSGGQTNTSGGQTNTSGGQTNTSGGQTNTSGGQTNTSGGQTITLGGRTVTYRVRRSARAKHPSLRARPSGITVVLPRRTTVNAADILRQKASWVLKYDEQMRHVRQRMPQRSFEPGASFPILGRDRSVRVADTPASYVSGATLLDGDQLVLSRNRVNASSLHEELEHLYRETARDHFSARAKHFGDLMQVTYGRIQIRNQKTRWGSFTPKTGTLSMNYRLLMAPPEVVDYIVVHELAHAVHPNHSADFWALVETYDPSFREKEAWLDTHGATLIFDGRHL
jgi:hypothetical protein